MGKVPNNTDLMAVLSELSNEFASFKATTQAHHSEKIRRLEAIEEQVRYTNGQVKELKLWRSNLDAINSFKRHVFARTIALVSALGVFIGALWWLTELK